MISINMKNCNNIEEWNISIIENCLNIKYAINWTGKTTIWRAIDYSIEDRNRGSRKIMSLKSFKWREKSWENDPIVTGIDDIKVVKVFDEAYVNQFVFKPDEVIENSFSIFIESEEYKKWLIEINELMIEIKTFFEKDENINKFIDDLKHLIASCWNSSSGIHGASIMKKWLSTGNLITNIPKWLEDYKDYIKSESRVSWLARQNEWLGYLDISETCPFCVVSKIENERKKIDLLIEKYNPKVIEHLSSILKVFNELKEYFTESVEENINKIKNSVDWLTDDQRQYLFNIKTKSVELVEKLEKIKSMSFHSLKDIDVDKFDMQMQNYKIDLSYYVFFNTQFTQDKVDLVNKNLQSLIGKTDGLKKSVWIQRALIRKTIEGCKSEINYFLKYAGYKYSIDSVEENDKYKIVLKHQDLLGKIDNAKDSLSFGERNAFALVLFMFDAIKENADLIILDDPISSFDKNKKYAIMNMLFKWKSNLQHKTVLLLTHDFEPIIDAIYNRKPDLSGTWVNAYFITNRNGILEEKEIKKENIISCIKIAIDNIDSDLNDINKLIYLRRLFEITGSKWNWYNILSSLFHKRVDPIKKEGGHEIPLSPDEEKEWLKDIRQHISSFDYNKQLKNVMDLDYMMWLYKNAENNYEKLQLYRIIMDDYDVTENDVIKKFINESFHIENDYLFQLNPHEYEIIPQYIIDECDQCLKKLSADVDS